MSNAAPTQRRHRLVIEPMTAESFAPFGRVLESSEEPVERRVMTPLPFDCDGRTTVHAIWQPCTGRSFSRLERHFGVTQTFVQVAGSPSVVCAAPPTDLVDEGAVPRPTPTSGRSSSTRAAPSRSPAAPGTPSTATCSAPPGATFVILNVDPNPTQIVDYADGTSIRYADLDVDAAPAATGVDTGPPLVFEL